jgi:hypothetical protein
MKKLLVFLIALLSVEVVKLACLVAILFLTGCSTLQVDGVSYNAFMASTDTLIITRPDGSKITMKGKATIDPAVLSGLLTK